MLQKIVDFYNNLLEPQESSETDAGHQLRLAATALMVEVMRVDQHMTDAEIEVVLQSVMRHFDVTREEAEPLLQLASEEMHDATDYHQFTSLINQDYGQEQRQQIIEFLWQIAYADGDLDKYEEHVVRKISDLLYVPHKDFIRLKEKVRQTVEGTES